MPSSLLLYPMPDWHKILWVSIRSIQGRYGACPYDLKRICERCPRQTGKPMDKAQAIRGISALLETPFLTENEAGELVCIVDQESTAACTSVDQESTIIDQESTSVDQESIRTLYKKPNINLTLNQRLKHDASGDGYTSELPGISLNQERPEEAPPKKAKAKTPKKPRAPRPDLPKDGYPFRAQLACNTRLVSLGVIERLPSEADQMKHAHVFRRLMEIDHQPQEVVNQVMAWLLQPDNWWIQNGNFASPMKLRRKDRDGVPYFQTFKTKATHAATSEINRRETFDEARARILANTRAALGLEGAGQPAASYAG